MHWSRALRGASIGISFDQTAFIHTMRLRSPGDAVMALMLAASDDVQHFAGSANADRAPTVFWGLIASFRIGNVALLILNLPFSGVWVRLHSLPYRLIPSR